MNYCDQTICDTVPDLMQTAIAALLGHTQDKVFIKDEHLIYRGASESFARMAGAENVREIIGKTDFELFHQDLAHRYREDDNRLIVNQKDLLDYLEPITEKDGKPRYASTSKFILRNAQGQFIGLLGISRDVTTDYYIQRNAIRELEYLFALPPDVYFAMYLDITDWRIVGERQQAIDGYCFATHDSVDTLFIQASERIVDRRSQAGAFYQTFNAQHLTELYNGGKRQILLEYLRQLKDGSLRWVRDELRYFHDQLNGHLCLMLVVRDIRRQKQEEEERRSLADRDEMTGLLNRSSTMRLISEHLAKETENNNSALMMIDADHFKDINDTFGHQVGDAVLAEFAETLRSCFRSTDLVGRIGGDEFFVLMERTSDRNAIEEKARQVLDALRKVEYGGIRISASIGISIRLKREDTLNSLYEQADQALYYAKRNGRNRAIFADEID